VNGPPNGGRPPPLSAGSDPPIERFPGQLRAKFNGGGRQPQDAGLIPLARLAYLARQIHRLGERPLYEIFVELQAGGALGPVLERYARIGRLADFIAANNGDRLPQPRLIPGRRA
jgi:hypothetical protein